MKLSLENLILHKLYSLELLNQYNMILYIDKVFMKKISMPMNSIEQYSPIITHHSYLITFFMTMIRSACENQRKTLSSFPIEF